MKTSSLFTAFLGHRIGRAQVFGRYRGQVYMASGVSLFFLIAVSLGCFIYWIWRRDVYAGAIVNTFWGTTEFLFLGLALLAFIALAPWFTIPFLRSGIHWGPERYVFRRDTWIFRCAVLVTLTIVTVIATALAIPGLVLTLAANGVGSRILWLVGTIPTVVGPFSCIAKWLYNLLIIQSQPSPLPPLTDFPLLRPQNCKVINLDIGALAPKLFRVSNILQSWNRLAEERAPTSKAVWTFASQGPGNPNLPWKREAWFSAWQGVEILRERMAELLRVLPEDVVFVTSTTRALDIALESVKPTTVITTDHEHESEYHLLSLMEAKYGTKIIRIPIQENQSVFGWKSELFVNTLVTACIQHQASALLISHVCYSNGWLLPVEKVCKELIKRRCTTQIIIDGAHAVGQIEVNLSQFPFHFYALSGHKWLFGPATQGILVLGEPLKSNKEQFTRLFGEAYEALAFRRGPSDESSSTISLDPLVGLAASITGLMEPSIDDIWENLRNLRKVFEEQAQGFNHITVLTLPGPPQSPGILNIQRKGAALELPQLENARNELERRSEVVTKVVSFPVSLRICLPFYLRVEEMKFALKAIDTAFART